MLLKIVLSCFLLPASSLNILVLFPHPGKSHFDAFLPLVKALATRGHHMTVVSHFPRKAPLPNYTDISLKNKDGIYLEFLELEDVPRSRMRYYKTLDLLEFMMYGSCESLQSKEVKQLAESEVQFDLILMEMFVCDCFLGFVHKFQAPLIGLSSCVVLPWHYQYFGLPEDPAYIPSLFLPFSDEMNLLERSENLIMNLYSKNSFNRRILEPSYQFAKELFGEDLPDLEDIWRNASLLLVNTWFSLNRPKPLPPSVVEVGGMFIKQEIHRLPEVCFI